MGSGMFINAGPLFGRAQAAYGRARKTSSEDRELGQMDALDAIVFAAVALEAFVNEAVELAAQLPPPGTSNPPSVNSFATLLAEVERSHGSIQLKFMLAHQVFTGTTYDAGRLPYQDFALLVRLRNAIAHYRPEESVSASATQTAPKIAIQKTPKFVAELRARKLASKESSTTLGSWLVVVSTVAVARWSCQSAAAMVLSLLDALPASHFKDQMEFFYRVPFRMP